MSAVSPADRCPIALSAAPSSDAACLEWSHSTRWERHTRLIALPAVSHSGLTSAVCPVPCRASVRSLSRSSRPPTHAGCRCTGPKVHAQRRHSASSSFVRRALSACLVVLAAARSHSGTTARRVEKDSATPGGNSEHRTRTTRAQHTSTRVSLSNRFACSLFLATQQRQKHNNRRDIWKEGWQRGYRKDACTDRCDQAGDRTIRRCLKVETRKSMTHERAHCRWLAECHFVGCLLKQVSFCVRCCYSARTFLCDEPDCCRASPKRRPSRPDSLAAASSCACVVHVVLFPLLECTAPRESRRQTRTQIGGRDSNSGRD